MHPPPHRTTTALAVYATTQAAHAAMHPACDHIVQNSADAQTKALPGRDGHWACVRHVASYTAVQIGALTTVTRVLGARLPWRAVAAGAAVNAITHYVIDRRRPLLWLLDRLGKTGYIEHATAMRRPGVVDTAGPGTALTECDQAVHHACSAAASLLTAWLATRPERSR